MPTQGHSSNSVICFIQSALLLLICRTTVSVKLEQFTSCNNVIDMDDLSLNQAELSLAIKNVESSGARVSCDFTIKAGPGRQVMFYFTDLYLGAPNRTERVDKACIEPKDVTGPYEIVPTGMRAIICSRTEVEMRSRVYATAGNALSIRFYRNRGYSITVYFKLVFTAFRSGSCRTSERKCSNERCILHDIVCNGNNPCGDHSDCPTGLEHLSSWAMSGIVVLALLSGGIFIIMAGICLQRASSKRFDIDDIAIPANGSLCHGHHVELNDIVKPTNHSQSEKPDENKFKDTQWKSCDGNDNTYISKHYNQSVNKAPTGTDREQLIQSEKYSSEDPSVSPYTDFGNINYPDFKHTNMYHSATEQNQDPQSINWGSLQNSDLLIPNGTLRKGKHNIQSQDGFYFSGNSLLYSDSESGGENERFEASSLDRKRLGTPYMKLSNSHNGTINSETPTTGDFKPPPPLFCFVKKPVIEEATNNVKYV